MALNLVITLPDSTKLEFRLKDQDCIRLIQRSLQFEQVVELTTIRVLLRVAFHLYAGQAHWPSRSISSQVSEAIYQRAGSFGSDDQVTVIFS